MIGLVLSSVDRYAYGLHYDSAVYASYNYDLPLLQHKLRSLDDGTSVVLVTSKNTIDFYTIFAEHQKYIQSLTVVSKSSNLPPADITITERDFAPSVKKIPSEILVTRSSSNADRFYLYKNDAS